MSSIYIEIDMYIFFDNLFFLFTLFYIFDAVAGTGCLLHVASCQGEIYFEIHL